MKTKELIEYLQGVRCRIRSGGHCGESEGTEEV